jgi:hypothetical protein
LAKTLIWGFTLDNLEVRLGFAHLPVQGQIGERLIYLGCTKFRLLLFIQVVDLWTSRPTAIIVSFATKNTKLSPPGLQFFVNF